MKTFFLFFLFTGKWANILGNGREGKLVSGGGGWGVYVEVYGMFSELIYSI